MNKITTFIQDGVLCFKEEKTVNYQALIRRIDVLENEVKLLSQKLKVKSKE